MSTIKVGTTRGVDTNVEVFLRMGRDDLCYEWEEAVIYRNVETGYYAFHTDSGCSCSYYEENWSEDFFKHELVWHPRPIRPGVELMEWIMTSVQDKGERVAKLEALKLRLNQRLDEISSTLGN